MVCFDARYPTIKLMIIIVLLVVEDIKIYFIKSLSF